MPRPPLNAAASHERNRRIGRYENTRNDNGQRCRHRGRMQVRAARQVADFPAPFEQVDLEANAAAQRARLQGSAVTTQARRNRASGGGFASTLLTSLVFLSLINGVGGVQSGELDPNSPQDETPTTDPNVDEQTDNADIFDSAQAPDPAPNDGGASSNTQQVLHADSVLAASRYLTEAQSGQNAALQVQTQMVFTSPECRTQMLARILAPDASDGNAERPSTSTHSASQAQPSASATPSSKTYNNKVKWTSKSPSANSAIAALNKDEFARALGHGAVNQENCMQSLGVETMDLPEIRQTVREQARMRQMAEAFEPSQTDQACKIKKADAVQVTGVAGTNVAQIPEVECRPSLRIYTEPTQAQLESLTGRLSRALCVSRVAIISEGIDADDVNNHVSSTTVFNAQEPHAQDGEITSAMTTQGASSQNTRPEPNARPSEAPINNQANMANGFVRAALRRCPQTQFQDIRAANLVENGPDLPSSSLLSAQAVTQALDTLFEQEGQMPESVVLLDNHEVAGYHPDITATTAIVRDLTQRGVRVFAYESSRGSWLSRVPGVIVTSSISATLARPLNPSVSTTNAPTTQAATTETTQRSTTEETSTELPTAHIPTSEEITTEVTTNAETNTIENPTSTTSAAAKCELRPIKHDPKVSHRWILDRLQSVQEAQQALDRFMVSRSRMTPERFSQMQGYQAIGVSNLQDIEAMVCNIKTPQTTEEKVAVEAVLSAERSVRGYLDKMNSAIDKAKQQLARAAKVKQRPVYDCRENPSQQNAIGMNNWLVNERAAVFGTSITNIQEIMQAPVNQENYQEILAIQNMISTVLGVVEGNACKVKQPNTAAEKAAYDAMQQSLRRIREQVTHIDELVLEAGEQLAFSDHGRAHAHGQDETNADNTNAFFSPYQSLALLAIGLSTLGLTLFCCNKKKTNVRQEAAQHDEGIPLHDIESDQTDNNGDEEENN